MKAIVSDRYGTPDDLRIEEVPRPGPGDDQVLVKIRALSINAWDWDSLTGRPYEYRLMSGVIRPRSRLIHGCDIAGKVEQVGGSVRRFQVGDAVLGDLGADGWGAFAEYVCAAEQALTPKPACLSFEQAACIAHGGNLAVQGLVDYGRIESGQRVLINGGGGSTGTLAIQIAKSFGAEVTAVDHPAKLQMMLDLGADQVIDYTQQDFTRSGRRYDLVLDVRSERSVFRYLDALAAQGAYVTLGGKSLRVLQTLLFGRLVRKYRLHVVVYQANKDSAYLVGLVQANKLRPVIDRCFPLAETAEAFRCFGTGQINGKVVVTSESFGAVD